MPRKSTSKAAKTTRKPKLRASYHVSDPRLYEIFLINGKLPDDSEIVVTENTIINCSVVWSCVRLIAETLSMLPCKVYRRVNGYKELAPEHQLYPLLHDAPNDNMTAFSFWSFVVTSLLLWGNAFVEIVRNNAEGIIALNPIMPNRVDIKVNPVDGKLVYYISTDSPNPIILESRDILHIPALSMNGLIGLSPIRAAANAVGLSMAAESYARKYFEAGAIPSYIVSHPEVLGQDGVEYLEKYIASRTVSRQPLILEEGIKLQTLSVNPVDSQLLEQRKWQRNEIITFFRCPVSKLGGDAPSNTYGNREADNAAFLQETIAPWAERIEQEVYRKTLWGTEYLCEFDMDAYLRGDTTSRYAAYASASGNAAWLLPDEIRAIENMPPLPQPEPVAPTEDIDPTEETESDRSIRTAFLLPMLDVIRRMSTKEIKALDNADRDKRLAFAQKHIDTLRSAIEPTAVGMALALGHQPADIDAFLDDVINTRCSRIVMQTNTSTPEQDAEQIIEQLYKHLRGK